jgi:hypothetical protein
VDEPDVPCEHARARTRRWLERAVIGLNLCPFAKGPHVKGQVHLAVCRSPHAEDLLTRFGRELDDLAAADPAMRETTLLVAPMFHPDDFLSFNGFLPRCQRVIKRTGRQGVIQLASFHPLYRFAGAQEDDIANYTNRAPYPTLHLLREDSIDRAVQAFPRAETIYETNIETMRRLGPGGWKALGVDA